MSNSLTTKDQPNLNGHYHSSQDLFEEVSGVKDSSHIPSTQSDTSVSVHDDWSSLTKELIDTLPRVWTRGLLYFLVIFAGIILPWAILFKVDETGSARGRLEPKGKTIRLDTPVAGTVTQVFVKEGQTIAEQQPLLELESEEIKTELQQVRAKLEGQLDRLAQLEVLKNQVLLSIRTQEQQNQAQQLEKQAQVEQARQNYSSLQNTYNLQEEEKSMQVAQVQQNIESSQTAFTLAKIRLAEALREVQRYRKLWQQGAIAEVKVVEQEDLAREKQRLKEQAQSDVQQAKLRQAEQQSSYEKIMYQAQSEIAQAQLRLQEQQKSYQSLVQAGKLALLKSDEQFQDLEGQIVTLKAENSQSRGQIKSGEYQLGQRLLRAPISGTIFQLPIQRTGAVVQPSMLIAEIAPKNYALILKAQIATAESGSLRPGMPVKMKFDAYPFQDYGVVEGKLLQISPTSKVTETNQGASVTFDLEIALEQTCIQIQKGCAALVPGQTATAEVIVRQRRIIDYILDPFNKLQKGGVEL